MTTLVLIGLVGGLIAGVSPCILPVLPVIFMSGTQTREAEERERIDPTPYLVVAGLALSFSVFTLLGTLILEALPLPDDAIRWAGLVLLVLLGVGMIVPPVERLIERPFARLGSGRAATGRRGFVLGLALGAVYVPCAGPVLAAITVAGATGRIGGDTIALTIAFAVGTSAPLLVFALAGHQVGQRVRAFREHQRGLRVAGGIVVIALAVALTFNLSDVIQRAVPDYTAGAEAAVAANPAVQKAVAPHQSKGLRACANQTVNQAAHLEYCGQAPPITGIDSWFNTADDAPVTASELKGKVYLVDFWAYSCINCQRAIPHVEAWYQKYKADGLEVIGVHTPEYAFEHDRGNVEAGAKRLGITYPVALDNEYGTWNSFGNDSWPAEYLVDATGQVRHVAIGEGDYSGTESLIRQLLTAAHPAATLPSATNLPDTTPRDVGTPETYLGAERAQFYVGGPRLRPGVHTFTMPGRAPQYGFTLGGTWNVAEQDLTARRSAQITLAYAASKVYLDVGGTGTVTVRQGDRTRTYRVHGAPDIYPVVDSDHPARGSIVLSLTPGLHAYSFTFG